MNTNFNAADMLASFQQQAASQQYIHADDTAFFADATWIKTPEVRARVLMERAIIRSAVTELQAAGFLIGVFDGEATTVERTTYLDPVMAAVMTTDSDTLSVYTTYGAVRRRGFLLLVYGNDGFDVIADSAVALEDHIAQTNAFAEALAQAAEAQS